MCAKSYEIAAIDDLPSFPFCSDRCKLIDLGRWIDGQYVIPGATNTERQQGKQGDAAESDED
jgi:endogenous inhibitor of DNA gyrase (YacG/DUF329 family)